MSILSIIKLRQLETHLADPACIHFRVPVYLLLPGEKKRPELEPQLKGQHAFSISLTSNCNVIHYNPSI